MSDSAMRCAMTGLQIRDTGDGIWDDGEWVSWAWINDQLAAQESAASGADCFPLEVQPRDAEMCRLICEAIEHERVSAGPSPLWGRIGELYVAERFDVVLGRSGVQGHDGRLRNDLVEIKTITPRKRRAFVRVKRDGNFNVLAVVRVNDEYLRSATVIDGNWGDSDLDT